ncbi:hypothetical protein FRB90_006583 [Tulasnella sp. 427]|nr:hypothetical protein FRB90_006583 [Tulasnella sp. 427]
MDMPSADMAIEDHNIGETAKNTLRRTPLVHSEHSLQVENQEKLLPYDLKSLIIIQFSGLPNGWASRKFGWLVGALRVATIFGNQETKDFIVNLYKDRLVKEDPFNVIDAAKLGEVEDWLQPQYIRIASRATFPTPMEAERLGVQSLLKVRRLREELIAMLDPVALTHHSDEDFESVETPEQEKELGAEDSVELSASSDCTPPEYKYLPLDSNELITVQVDNRLFEISADILRLCAAIQTPITNPLYISGLSGSEFNAFLRFAHFKMIRGQPRASLGAWEAILHVATQLQCQEIRDFAISSMKQDVDSLENISLVQIGLRYQVLEWAVMGFSRLIERQASLTDEEGDALGMYRVLAIYRCREALARSQDKGDCSALGLIDDEPALNNPTYDRLAEVGFEAPADDLLVSEALPTYSSTLVDLATEGTIWRVSTAVLGSTPYFESRVNEQKSSGGVGCVKIDLGGEVSEAELDSYLSVANARLFQHSSGKTLGLSFQQWISALRLATIFGHADARRFVINFIEPLLTDHDPFYIIDSAKTCNIEHWLMPQYERVAKRRAFPSDEEGRQLGVASLMAVCRLREEAAYKKGKEERPVSKASSSRAKGEWDPFRILMPRIPKEVAKASNVGLQVPRAVPANLKTTYGSHPGVTPNY